MENKRFAELSEALNKRVWDLISRMTLEEKISFMPYCHPAIERLGLPAFSIGGEGAHGLVVREGGESTAFPQPLGLSMTWNKELMKKIGEIIGDEARVYYVKRDRADMLTLFFPTIDMERDPRWGRNEEAYGEDPFLAGKLAVELIKGAQGDDGFFLKIATTPKHFYANNYEFERSSTNSIIEDEQLRYEYYLRVFAYVFEEVNAASLMTAYNKMNGIPGMLHPEMNEIVRGKWNADGFFVSDGGAFRQILTEHKAFETYGEAAAAAIKAGLDCFLDDPDLSIDAVTDAVKRGLLSEKEVEGALFNQLRTLFRLGVYDKDSANPYLNIPETALCSKENSMLARKASLEAMTLLKNDGFLPLNKNISKIAVIGQLGDENLPDWYSGTPPYQITPLEGIKKAFPNSEVVFSNGCDIAAFYNEATGAWLRVDEKGTVSMDGTETTRTMFKIWDWGHGIFGFQSRETNLYLTTTIEGELRCDAKQFWGWFVRESFFLEGGKARDGKFISERPHGSQAFHGIATRTGVSIYDKPYSDDGVIKINETLGQLTVKILTDGIENAVETAKGADAVIVTIGNHTLIGGRECIDREDINLPERWAVLFEKVSDANKNTVLALIAGYPYDIEKQENKARAVLFTTHGAQEVGTAIGETLSGDNNPAGRLSMTWYKGTHVLPDINDYDIRKNKMTYLYCDQPVLYTFGYGLSYTSFEYADLSLTETNDGISAKFTLKNTGKVAGDEVAQLYFTQVNPDSPRPIKQLAGFERLNLKPGETRQIEIFVPFKELMCYDIKKGAFVLEKGAYKFAIGAGSADIRLESGITLQ